MWKFIDQWEFPNKLVIDRSSLTYEQVLSAYSKLEEIDSMFRENQQIKLLKKELDEITQ